MHLLKALALVFMSPETAITTPWRNLFREGKIALVAIDEAHCISEWLVLQLNETKTNIFVYGK